MRRRVARKRHHGRWTTLARLPSGFILGRPHHREGGPDILEPDQSADQRPFDCRLALELEAQFDEERLGGFEIVDNDEDVVHPFKRHVFLPSLYCWCPLPTRTLYDAAASSPFRADAGSARCDRSHQFREADSGVDVLQTVGTVPPSITYSVPVIEAA